MPDPSKRTQKDIALIYAGSAPSFQDGKLDYFRRMHWFRKVRLWLFLIAAIGSVGLVFGYSFLVGPNARNRWNTDLRQRVSEALKTGEKVAQPWDPEELFNTGPISENHSRLEGGCQACHWGANPDAARLVGLGKAVDAQSAQEGSTFAKLGLAWKKEGSSGLLSAYQKLTKLEQMDAACVTCHVQFQQLPVSLHLPQSPQLHLAKVSFPFAVVDAGACSNCHKEHVGHHRMAEVSSQTCESCHAKPGGKDGTSEILNVLNDPHRGKVLFPSGQQAVLGATTAEVGEGIMRFLVWRAPGSNNGFDAQWNRPFRFYGPEDPRDRKGQGFEGHPPFRYELPTARDPGRLRYGHAQHEQAKVRNLFDKTFEKEQAAVAGLPIREWLNRDGSQNCLYCHESGQDGEFRQPIRFERHCQNCHRMDIVVPPLLNATTGQQYPFVARINIPHRDPEKVRAFLDQQSLLVELDRSALNAGYNDQRQRREYVETAFTSLKNRGIENPLELLKRVFYTGDPAYESWRQSPTTNKALNACALCHRDQLSPPTEKDYLDIYRAPAMAPTGIAHRWANHGPFTHEPHKHMKCVDCHANSHAVVDPRTNQPVPSPDKSQPGKPMTYSVKSAHESRISADILMPRQRLCAECHRPMPNEAAAELAAAGGPTGGKNVKAQAPEERTRSQRATGGIKYECLDCHKFHAPSEALPLLEQLQKAEAKPAPPAPAKKQASLN
jgi:hypothetical protein